MMYANTLALTILTALSAVAALRVDVYPAPGRANAVEYDIVVPPGADPARITLRFDGRARLDSNGDLLVAGLDGSDLRHSAPVSYQLRDGVRTYVESRFRLAGDRAVRFEVGSYDPAAPLVIDPVVTASRTVLNSGTFSRTLAVDSAGNAYYAPRSQRPIRKISPLGVVSITSGFNVDENALLAVDSAGNVYVAEISDCPAGATTFGSITGPAIVVRKFLPNLVTRSYALCLLPGAANTVESIEVDSSGTVYLGGTTTSDAFPATANFGSLISGRPHLYVLKVNPQGNGLPYSIVTGNDISKPSLALDRSGNAYVAGRTGPQFEPRQAFRAQFEGGATDGFLLKILPDAANIPFATFLGGSTSNGVAVDSDGNPVFLSDAVNLPVIGPFSLNASPDAAYVGKLSPDGQQILLGTFVPRAGNLAIAGVLKARGSDLYLLSQANEASVPLINPIAGLPAGSVDSYVVKLDVDLRRVLATRFGGSAVDQPFVIAPTQAGFVLSGTTFSSDLPARVNAPEAPVEGFVSFISESADLDIRGTRTGNQHQIRVMNFGPDNTTGVRISASFPSNNIVSAPSGCSVKNIGISGFLNCQVGTLFYHFANTITVTTANAADGNFSATSALNDPNPGNN